RIETLATDMENFLTGLGYPVYSAAQLTAPHPLERRDAAKITQSAQKEHFLTPMALGLIDTLYKEDFETFGYDHRSA
ncbi:MAG: hypothetical protein AAGF46_12830, partial [Pseudomonadota bacterium]